MKPNAYTTMQRARSLRERHPDASPSVIVVALALASFADGPTGTSIRPGNARLAEITGLDPRTVRRAVRWLEKRGEIWRVKEGRRGSAACFTYRLHDAIGGHDTPESGIRGREVSDTGASYTPHHSHPVEPSGLPGPRGGKTGEDGPRSCGGCGKTAELRWGYCRECVPGYFDGR